MAGILPKGGLSWKAAGARLPPARPFLSILTRTRSLVIIVFVGIILLTWRGISASAGKMQRFYCWGPDKPPMEMSMNDQVRWHGHLQTPVVFNHHEPLEVNSSTIKNIDLNPIKSTTNALQSRERILILTPLKDAAPFLSKYFELLAKITYPHELIDLGFLISDTTDETMAVLASELERLQERPDNIPFNSATIIQKDFGFFLSQDVHQRHSFEAQGPRRKNMGRARNYLLSSALKPEHSWVYWRDVDIVDIPSSIIEDFIAHDKDILVPNIWFHRYRDDKDVEGRFDYNSWVESEKGRKVRATLDPNIILAEGYKKHYDLGRRHMCQEGDWREDRDVELELDGIGGVNILVKSDVHRTGINFPAYAFENQAETEGFARMAKRAGYQVIGLPNYVVWHVDTQEKSNH